MNSALQTSLWTLVVAFWVTASCATGQDPRGQRSSGRDPAGESHPDTVLSRISFGSCAFEGVPQPIWNRVVEEDPQLWIWAGDNIYIDLDAKGEPRYAVEASTAEGFAARARRKYERLFANEDYRNLLSREPFVLATWDDHDFGLNDAGVEFAFKREAQDVFLDVWGVPEDSPRRGREGVYHCASFGPEGQRVQVILLDTRTHRSSLESFRSASGRGRDYRPRRDRGLTVLGEAQWAWLGERLREPADLRIVVSSIQFLAEEHRFEKWANLPSDRRRMLRLIDESGATGVVFVSGDRHHGELSKLEREDGYPIYELTSSGLTQSGRSRTYRIPEPNRYRIGTVARGQHFGDFDIDWSQPDPTLRMRIVYGWGEVPIEATVRLGELGRPVAAADSGAGVAVRLESAMPSPARMVVDGRVDDWAVPTAVSSDGSHVYLRFRMPEVCSLNSIEDRVRIVLDLDGSDGTGRTENGLDGADLLLEFHPEVGDDRQARNRYRYLPRISSLYPGRDPVELDASEVDFQLQPSHASDLYELRVLRHPSKVPTEIQMAQDLRTEAKVLLQTASGGGDRTLVDDVALQGRKAFRRPTGPSVEDLRKAEDSLRVVSWNVLWGSPQDPEHTEKFARIFRALQPDILLLQEWDQSRYSEEEIATWFRDHVDPDRTWSAMVTGVEDYGQGTAVVTWHPILVRAPAHLPVEGGRWNFAMRLAAAVIDTPSARVLAGSLHLKAGGSLGSPEDERRAAEARTANALMLGLAAGTSPDLVVLGGDLNMNGTTEVERLLFRGLDLDRSPLQRANPTQLADPGLVYTFGRGPSKARLDYLGYSDANAEPTRAFVFDTTLLDGSVCEGVGVRPRDAHGSDHLPVVLDLRPRSKRDR